MKTLISLPIALGFALVVSAQQTTTVITVNGARPLCDAIMKLEKASGQPITYEDAPYLYDGDLVDVNATEFASVPHTPGAKLIKARSLNFPYTPSEVADRAGTAKVLQRLVTTFNKTYPDGAHFIVLDDDGLFHVIPKSVRAASGAAGPYTSPLDVPLTLLEKEVSVDVALKAIVASIKATTGTTVGMGSPLIGLKGTTTVSISNDPATGRTMLTQSLQILDPSLSLSWKFLTAPDPRYPTPGYIITIGSWAKQ